MEQLVFDKQRRKSSGYITLVSVLIIGAIGVTLTTAVILAGVSTSQTSFTLEQGKEARALADACAEEALQQIRDNASYTGSSGLTYSNGTCTYSVVSTGGENRTIEAEGLVGTIRRRAELTIDTISPQINIVTWQEVADF